LEAGGADDPAKDGPAVRAIAASVAKTTVAAEDLFLRVMKISSDNVTRAVQAILKITAVLTVSSRSPTNAPRQIVAVIARSDYLC
jgi:hypothetical protein